MKRELEDMKWELTEDQKVLVRLLREYRMALVSNEEIAVTITEAGFSRTEKVEKAP